MFIRREIPRNTMSYPRNSALVAIALLGLAGCRGGVDATEKIPSGRNNTGNAVGCMGRILPENGTIFVSPYSVNGGTPVVELLFIKSGDRVVKGQEIATLSSRRFLETTVSSAQAQVALAEARLAKTRAAGSPDDAAVAKEEVARLQIQRDTAALEYERNKPLYDKNYLSKSQIESLQSRLGDSEALLTQARERFRGISAARPEDVAIAQAELDAARADLRRARQDASSSIVLSPVNAQVLQITAHPGEPIGPHGIAELAEAGKMQVVAEVYEADIARVHTGQKATITSDLLPQPLTGTVVLIGSEIARQEPLSADPAAPADARIFQARIDVSEQSVLAERIHGKVNVVSHP
jgi:HlyD family secretion protein